MEISHTKNLLETYRDIRQLTETLCQTLNQEDYVIQAMEDVSPPKWHLAHTTWFFETFLLSKSKGYKKYNEHFHYLFNSYYQTIGKVYPRHQRGILARPTVAEVYAYRKYVNEAMYELLEKLTQQELVELQAIVTLGLQHEQQHQELLLMDIKYNYYMDPTYPVYHKSEKQTLSIPPEFSFMYFQGGLIDIGSVAQDFCFDNELPQHTCVIKPFHIANRLISNGEFLAFIEAQGYQRPELWLADGWTTILKEKWQAPLYWRKIENTWYEFTLSGLKALDLQAPVSHVSFYEAEAYSRWREARLPTEFEWEYCANQLNKLSGNFLENKNYHPYYATSENKHPQQLFGDVWEWTSSPYIPYPGYKALNGALGEYNGKFMNNQIVLRGGSCITPQSHIRTSYRNFYQQDKRWQFGGIRLCQDTKE